MRYREAAGCLAGVAAAISIAAVGTHGASQQQPSGSRANWPCGARIDPAYFHIAEASGGHLFLLAPFEIGDSAPLMLALGDHPQTIFRLAGSITPGIHEFAVPIDTSVESVVFSISVQCLQVADVLDPSGTPAAGDGVSDYSNFRAERMIVVKQPRPGTWKLRAGGSGLAGVMVQAHGGIALTNVEFAAAPGAEFRPTPAAGVENIVRIHVSGPVGGVQASVVNAAFKQVARLPLTAGDGEGTFVTRLTPGPGGFRIAVTGEDAQGLPFQRVHAPLFTAR